MWRAFLDWELVESPDEVLPPEPGFGIPGTPELVDVMAKLVLEDSSINVPQP